jgi:serine/threonine protein kinase
MLHRTSPVFIQRTAALVNRFPAFRTFAAFLQEWVPGGELFHHLDIEGSFSDAAACFYAANVLLALECLHARGIVYRDLKPENLLLDTKVRITLRRAGGVRFTWEKG